MKITALDIHQKEFAHGMRGYREEEVDTFLDQLAVEADASEKRCKELEEKLNMLEARDASLAAERNTINNTLLTAQRAADAMLKKAQAECTDTLEAAQRQSEAQLESARQQADRIVEEARQKRHQVIGSFARLQGEEEKFRNGYLAQLESFLAGVRQLETDARSAVEEIAVPQDLKEELSVAQKEAVRAVARESAPAAAVAPASAAAAVAAPPARSAAPAQPAPAPAAPAASADAPGAAVDPMAAALADSDFFKTNGKASPSEADEPTLQQAPVGPAQQPLSTFAPDDAPAPARPAKAAPAAAASKKASASASAPTTPPTNQWGDMDDDLDIEEID